jgi:hypothetical protein
MGYSYGQNNNGRDIGYAVPAKCDHPRCNEDIDRGMSYKCETFDKNDNEKGCGLFFCGNHGGGYLCKRCQSYKSPYKEKPDTLMWIAHKLMDESWEKWRDDNPATVALYEARLNEL